MRAVQLLAYACVLLTVAVILARAYDRMQPLLSAL